MRGQEHGKAQWNLPLLPGPQEATLGDNLKTNNKKSKLVGKVLKVQNRSLNLYQSVSRCLQQKLSRSRRLGGRKRHGSTSSHSGDH